MNQTAKLNITRLITVILTLLLLSVQWMPVSAAESGECGADLEWSYSLGTLTITGSGDMTDFREPDMAPWYHLREEIRRVVFPDGMTSVGDLAFYDCKLLTTVVLPSSNKTIGSYAFAQCEKLTMLKLGGNETSIGDAAFYGCLSLDAVRLPYALETLGTQAFYRCESLTTVTIQHGLKEMGTSVFAYCKNLVSVTINARLTALPDWTFYGCESLSSVSLPETTHSVEDYAFKNCDSLATIYFSGNEEDKEAIRNDIAEDIPGFDSYGYISANAPSESNASGRTTDNGDGTVTQENVRVQQNENVTLVTQVDHTHSSETTVGGSYSADVTVTVENKDGWDSATDLLTESLKTVNDTYATNATTESIAVTVYMKDDTSPDGNFIQSMVGREIELTVVAPSGSSWQFDCAELEQDKLDGKYDLSYTIAEASEASRKKLGTDKAYFLNFVNSSTVKVEVLIQLPESELNYSNAFLYQIEEDGSHTRLQAVQIDQNAVAHFYLASVDKDTQYVIGVNVPGEKTDDVIIPDEIHSQYGDAIARLEKIEYVNTGVQSSWGLNFWQVTLIMVGVLVGCIIIVGVVFVVINKMKRKRNAPPPAAA